MINITNLTQYFGTLAAVNAVSFSVGKGEVFGLLGPNGAGKTTTIRMLTTLLSPSSGTASVAGYDVTADPLEVKRAIGVVPQMLNLDIDLTCAENLEYHGTAPQDGARGPGRADRGTAALRRSLGQEGHAGGASLGRHAQKASDRPGAHAPARRSCSWTSRRWGSTRRRGA